MAFTQTKQGGRLPLKAASAMGAYLPVTLSLGGSLGASPVSETVRLAPSSNFPLIGMSAATVVTAGDAIELFQRGDVGKGIAGASIGAGAFVGVGSSNGVLAPILPVDAGPSGLPRFALGICLSNAAAGDFISIEINPGQII